jgi:hypothetical protein
MASRFILWDGAVAFRVVSGIAVGVGITAGWACVGSAVDVPSVAAGIGTIGGGCVDAIARVITAVGTTAGGRMDDVLKVGVRDTVAVPLSHETASRAAPTARIVNRTARRSEII